MNQQFNIRRATFSDIPNIVENNIALAKETENLQLNKNILQLGVKSALKRNDCNYFVVETKGITIGQTMITNEWSDWRNGVIWWLQSVYVKNKFRNQGAFKAILNNIEVLAKKDYQVKALRLYVMQNNQSAQFIYKNLGINNTEYTVYEKKI